MGFPRISFFVLIEEFFGVSIIKGSPAAIPPLVIRGREFFWLNPIVTHLQAVMRTDFNYFKIGVFKTALVALGNCEVAFALDDFKGVSVFVIFCEQLHVSIVD